MAILIDRCPPGKQLATIVSIHPSFAMAIDATGEEYFLFHDAVERTSPIGFRDLLIGSHIYGTPIQHPKGWRLIEVQVREL